MLPDVIPVKTAPRVLNDAGAWSEAKFGTLLLCHCPLYRFYIILDPHKVITVELTGGGSLNALNEGATATDELVTYYG
jgi:hypothetical protein